MNFYKFFTKERTCLISLVIISFLLRAIPHLFIIPFIAREEGSLIYFAIKISSGDFSNVLNYPHLPIFLLVGLHKLTSLSLVTVASYLNPLISSLSTLLIYCIIKNRFKGKAPLLGVALFTFLDIHVYRTSVFSGSEGLGILLLLIFLYFYLDGKVFLSIITLPLLMQTHLLPFVVALLTIFADQIFIKKHSKKKSLKIIMMSSIVLLITFFLVFPYQLAQQNIFKLFSFFKYSNIYTLFNLNDLIFVLKTVLGSIILFTVTLCISIRKRNKLFIYLNLGIILIFFAFWFMYFSAVASPYRMLVYMGLIGVLGTSFYLKQKNYKHITFTVLICLLMFSSIVFYGWDLHNDVYGTVTSEELDAVRWLKDTHPNIRYNEIVFDDIGNGLLVVEFPIEDEPFSSGSSWRGDDVTKFIETNDSSVLFERRKYAIYSERLSKQATFRVQNNETNRVSYTQFQMSDVWKDNQNWELIYEKDGVKIYERQKK